MKKQKLTYAFHNPNTEEATLECITEILAEVAFSRVIEEQKKLIKKEKEKPAV